MRKESTSTTAASSNPTKPMHPSWVSMVITSLRLGSLRCGVVVLFVVAAFEWLKTRLVIFRISLLVLFDARVPAHQRTQGMLELRPHRRAQGLPRREFS